MKDKMKVGDVIAFADTDPISWLIRFFTGGNVSHVGMVLTTNPVTIIEAYQFSDFTGIGIVELSTRIEEYRKTGGSIWHLPLNKYNRMNINDNRNKFVNHITSYKEIAYDYKGAINTIFGGEKEDSSKLFCSEFISLTYEFIKILPNLNSSKITPSDLVSFRLFNKANQILGKTSRIKKYNKLSNRKIKRRFN